MTLPDTFHLAAGIPVAVIVPVLVEVAKRQGLPTRMAGVAAIGFAVILLALGSLALGEPFTMGTIARWGIGGIVYGLAAAGLYSQRRMVAGETPTSTADDIRR